MDITVRVQKCEFCNHKFKEGDLIYFGTNLFRSPSGETWVHCKKCIVGRIKPNYVFHNGQAVMILDRIPQHTLPHGRYELEKAGSSLTVMELSTTVPFGEKLTLDYRSASSYTLLLPKELQIPWKKLEFKIKSDESLSALKNHADYILIDSSRNVCGFSTRQDLPEELISEEEISENRISCILRSDLMDQYDNSEFATACRDAIYRLDPADLLCYCEQRIQGQGSELQKAVFLIWQYLQSVSSGEPFQAFNWFLTAPSGCGKTELFRTVRSYFKEHKVPIPVIQIDLSRVTEEGFKGMDPSEIVNTIVNEKKETTGYAICFLDEADKKLYSSRNSYGDDVNMHVQSGLLTLVEGCICQIEKDEKILCYDTSKTMFIFMGAFQNLRSARQRNAANPHSLGFLTETAAPEDAEESFYDPVTLEDMIGEGLQEELAGRIQQVINFRRLSDESMIALIQCKTREISSELGIEIQLTDRAEKELLSVAFGNLGVRKPLNKIREIALNIVSSRFFEKEAASKRICVTIEDLEHGVLTFKDSSIYYEKTTDICEAC